MDKALFSLYSFFEGSCLTWSTSALQGRPLLAAEGDVLLRVAGTAVCVLWAELCLVRESPQTHFDPAERPPEPDRSRSVCRRHRVVRWGTGKRGVRVYHYLDCYWKDSDPGKVVTLLLTCWHPCNTAICCRIWLKKVCCIIKANETFTPFKSLAQIDSKAKDFIQKCQLFLILQLFLVNGENR